MKFEVLILNCVNLKNEMEALKYIKNFLEREAIDATINIRMNGYEITVSPFNDILIKKSFDERGIKTFIEGELDKKYEDLVTFLFSYYIKKREDELKNKIQNSLKKGLEEGEKLLFKLEGWEKNILETDPLFFLFLNYKNLSKNLEEKKDLYYTFSDLSTFTFFKIINCEREEHLKEILYYTLRKLLIEDFEYFFLFFEDDILPINSLFSSFFMDDFFYDDLCRNKIRKNIKQIQYKNKKLYLFYSNLIEKEIGVLGVYTNKEISSEMNIFFTYLSTITLYFYLKRNIKIAYNFTKRILPVINIKAAILKYKRYDELIENLTKPIHKFNIVETVKEVLNILDFEIERKKIKVNIEKEEFICEGDRELLKIALLNLFKYLISFNRIRGYMSIYFREGEMLIEDSGIGLTKNDLELILDPQDINEPLSLSGIIFKTLGYDIQIDVERGIGNRIRIIF
ncbi:MAG: hypothetical protein ABIN23_02735 [candidate division WOR-3 bacterium]